MTTITVTAADTAQAMDKIVESLGEDALVLETVKRNGRIEKIATDGVEETEATNSASSPRRSTILSMAWAVSAAVTVMVVMTNSLLVRWRGRLSRPRR